jgi:hypothetical protein
MGAALRYVWLCAEGANQRAPLPAVHISQALSRQPSRIGVGVTRFALQRSNDFNNWNRYPSFLR